MNNKVIIENHTCIKKSRKCQVNNMIMYLKKLEKQKQTKSKISRHKEIRKIRAEINDVKI